MNTSVGPRNARPTVTYHSFVKPEFKKGYEISVLPYQQGGILSRTLWNTKEQIIRIIPGYDPNTGEIFRQNIKCNEYAEDAPATEYLSDTFMMARVVNRFGDSRQSFIIDYAPGSTDAQAFGSATVIDTFVRNVRFSVNDQKGRSKFGVTNDMRRWVAKDGIITFPKVSVLVQSLVFKVNGRDNMDSNGNLLVDEDGDMLPLLAVVAIDGQRTIQAVMSALVEPLDPSKPLDAITNNKYGGMAELKGNKMFLNPVVDTQNSQKAINYLRPSVQAAGKGWTPSPYELSAEVVRSLWVPWDSLLHYMTAEEQCKFLAAEFGADSVNYFIGTDPMFRGFEIPADIARVGFGRYAQFVGGATTINAPVTVSTTSVHTTAPTAGSKGLVNLNKPASEPSVLRGIPTGSGVDTNKLLQEVERIRNAASAIPTPAPNITDHAALAASLLEPTDEMYEDDNQ